MKLHGALASNYVARVVLFARLKGLTLVPQLPPGGLKSPEYLEDLHPGTGGLPGGPAGRARARLISRIHDVYVAPHTGALFRNMNPKTRDAAAVAAAQAALETGFGYLQHFVVAAPFAAGERLSLADCTLLPSFVILRKTAFPMFGVADPTTGDGPLGRWWSAVEADPLTGAFLPEYGVAVDAFLRMLSGK